MLQSLSIILLGLIVFAAIAGGFVYRNSSKAFHPFIYYLVVEAVLTLFGLNSDAISELAPDAPRNVFVPASFLFICWLAVKWKLSTGIEKYMKFVVVVLIIAGVLISTTRNQELFRWFNVVTDLIVIIIAIASLMKSIVLVESATIRTPMLFISLGLLLMYVFSVVASVFIMVNGQVRLEFLEQIQVPFLIVNIISYLLFIRAILCLPHQAISLQRS